MGVIAGASPREREAAVQAQAREMGRANALLRPLLRLPPFPRPTWGARALPTALHLRRWPRHTSQSSTTHRACRLTWRTRRAASTHCAGGERPQLGGGGAGRPRISAAHRGSASSLYEAHATAGSSARRPAWQPGQNRASACRCSQQVLPGPALPPEARGCLHRTLPGPPPPPQPGPPPPHPSC
jgi:hypothetical protein